MINVTMRNGELSDLRDQLQVQKQLRNDMVVPATSLAARGGNVVVKGDATLSADGVSADGTYRVGDVMMEGLAGKLGVPVRYLRKLHEERTFLWDATINGHLHGKQINRGGEREVIVPADERKFLVRTFKDADGGAGFGRALLSDKYKLVDNADAITAVLKGIQASGADVQVVSADITERNMFVQFAAPGVTGLAPTLLSGYRSPFADEETREQRGPLTSWERIMRQASVYGEDDPVVFAGFDVRNSEVGSGAFQITPRITVRVCKNGMTVPAAAFREIHLGGKMDAGVVDWSADTRKKQVELIQSQAKDAVEQFVSEEFLAEQLAGIEAKAGRKVRNAKDTIERVGRELAFSEEEQALVLDHFISGGQNTAGGIVNAITSASQLLENADRAYAMDDVALKALSLV